MNITNINDRNGADGEGRFSRATAGVEYFREAFESCFGCDDTYPFSTNRIHALFSIIKCTYL
jgi:hypothetical protein